MNMWRSFEHQCAAHYWALVPQFPMYLLSWALCCWGWRSANHIPALPTAPCANKGGAGGRLQGWRRRPGRAVSCLLPVPAGLTPTALPHPGKVCCCFPLDPVWELSTGRTSLIMHPMRDASPGLRTSSLEP